MFLKPGKFPTILHYLTHFKYLKILLELSSENLIDVPYFQISGTKTRECPYPVLRQNGSEMAIDVVRFLSGIAEVKFNGAFDKVGSKRYCKIKCISGEWVGPLCLLDGGKMIVVHHPP